VGDIVMEFKIDLVQMSVLSPFRFAICNLEFTTLDDLVQHFSVQGGNYFECEGHEFQLVRPISRGAFIGRFGYGEKMKIYDPANRRRIHTSFVRSLRNDFSSLPDVEDSLEALIELDHRNLAMIHDFFRFEMSKDVAPLIIVRYDFYSMNLFDHLYSLGGPLKTRRYMKWCYQVGKALDYLANNNIFHRRLHPRACLLDSRKRIKLSDYWTRDDTDDLHIYQPSNLLPKSISESVLMAPDGWRCMPVETLLNGIFDSASQVWSYSLLIWHIFTHCQFANRGFFTSLPGFLSVGAIDDPFYLPGHLTRAEANRGLSEERRRKIAFYKLSDHLPVAPDALAEKVPRCLARDPSERPPFEELHQVVETEYRIHKLSRLIGKFI